MLAACMGMGAGHPLWGVSAACVWGGCQPPIWGGGCLPTVGGIGSLQWEGKFIHPCVAKIEFGKAGEIEDITKKVKGIASCEFPKEKSLAV